MSSRRVDRSKELFHEARRFVPGGVNSPVRAWKSVGGSPLFLARGEGARVTDADGNEYVDFCASWGPLILGHAPPGVVEAIRSVAASGTSFGAPCEHEIRLARRIVEAVPSIEKVRLVSSGTEATMSAIRLARAHTGRNRIVKFAGCYHGHVDFLLVRAGSGLATLGIPDTPGVPEAFTAETRVVEFNDAASVRRLFAAEGKAIAAVVVEPCPGNMGVVPPAPGFLETLREETRAAGSLLVFDEVITGFRVARGGMQERARVVPDLTCLGKVIGGGLPVGAFGGRADVMDLLAPDGRVYQAGTLSGNPLAAAAGVATLDALDEEAYGRLESLGGRLEAGLREVLGETGVRAALQRVGSMWTLFFGVDSVSSYEEARTIDTEAYARFFHGMLDRGFYLPPSAYETAFLSLAHAPDDVDTFVEAARDALRGT